LIPTAAHKETKQMALCALPGCTLPVHVDAQTGLRHDFCGRTHAQQALKREYGRDLGPPHGSCHVCQWPGCRRQVFFEAATGRVHDFCGQTHATMAMRQGLHPSPNKEKASSTTGSSSSSSSGSGACALPGCAAQRYVDRATGRRHDYCGRTHAKLAEQRGLMPPSEIGVAETDADTYKIWRGRASDPPYAIAVLNNSHPKVPGVKEQFLASWKHPGPKPTVTRVLQVRNAKEIYGTYAKYRFAKGNEDRRWHGTALSPRCSFGIDPDQPPCAYPDCAVCNILARSFDLARAGSSLPGGQRMRLRYGPGLYFSKCSSKSNDYALHSERKFDKHRGTYRVMFLCKVAQGNVYRTKEPTIDDVQPILRNDYHSVVGLTQDHGGALNYEETVVYDKNAAIPSYLLVYRLP